MPTLTRKAEVLTMLGKTTALTAAEEGLLDLIHPLAESAVFSYLQQELQYARHVEYLPIGRGGFPDKPLDDVDFRGGSVAVVTGQAGSEVLQLKHTPVWLTGLEVREDIGGNAGQADGAFADATILSAGSDYWLDIDDADSNLSRTGMLRRFGVWPAEPRSVKVTYYGGWTATQLSNSGTAAVLKLAILQTVVQAFWAALNSQKNSGAGQVQSESIGSYSFSNGQGVARLNLGVVVPADAKLLLQPFRNYGRVFGGV